MKTKTTILFFILAIYCSHGAAQGKPDKNDSATYEYAILRFQRISFTKNLEVILPGYQIIDLKQKLNLDTVKFVDLNNNIDYQFVFPGINYMDKMGYELISSSVEGSTREYVFRRKRKTK
jgi:hypothetical protein